MLDFDKDKYLALTKSLKDLPKVEGAIETLESDITRLGLGRKTNELAKKSLDVTRLEKEILSAPNKWLPISRWWRGLSVAEELSRLAGNLNNAREEVRVLEKEIAFIKKKIRPLKEKMETLQEKKEILLAKHSALMLMVDEAVDAERSKKLEMLEKRRSTLRSKKERWRAKKKEMDRFCGTYRNRMTIRRDETVSLKKKATAVFHDTMPSHHHGDFANEEIQEFKREGLTVQRACKLLNGAARRANDWRDEMLAFFELFGQMMQDDYPHQAKHLGLARERLHAYVADSNEGDFSIQRVELDRFIGHLENEVKLLDSVTRDIGRDLERIPMELKKVHSQIDKERERILDGILRASFLSCE
jgi:chromosome segregation ATPase